MSKLSSRLLSASLIAPPVLWVLSSPHANLLVALLCTMNVFEYVRINCRKTPSSLLIFILFMMGPVLCTLQPNAYVPVLTALITLCSLPSFSDNSSVISDLMILFLTFMDIATIITTYGMMLMIPISNLKIYTATSAYLIDTAGLLVGRKFGGKYITRGRWLSGVSPNKSWEGYLAGLIASYMMAGIFVPGGAPPFSYPFFSFVASSLGDLYNSKCKRLANVKDTGTTMGAFGGVWDRMDSVMGNALVVFLYLFNTSTSLK